MKIKLLRAFIRLHFVVFIVAFPAILPAQNVGIGNTQPHAPLQFAQNFEQNRKIVLYEDADNDHQFNGFGINPFIMRYQVAGPAGNHVFYAGNGSAESKELMRIQGDGKVGIGISNPFYPLTIAGNNGTNGVIGLDNGASVFAKNTKGDYERAFTPRWTDNVTYINYGAGGFNILGNGGATSAMFMNNNGNVGIGTTTPGTKLEVSGGTVLGGSPDNSKGNIGMGKSPSNNVKLVVNSNQDFGVVIKGSSTTDGSMLYIEGASAKNMVTIDGNAANYHLYVDGAAAKTDGNAFWSIPSDARLKEQIAPYGEGLAALLKINPVKYHYTKASGLNNQHENIGILAQQLQEVAPYMVFKKKAENTNEEVYNVNLSPLLFMYINAFKELDAKNKAQEKRLATLEAMVAELKGAKH